MQRPLGNSKESGRPRRHGLKHRSHQLLAHIKLPDGLWVAVFCEKYENSSGKDQDHRHDDGQLGLQPQPCKPPTLRHFPPDQPAVIVDHVKPDSKTDTAQDDQQDRRHVYDRISHVTAQAAAPKNIDPCIAEGRDSMENGVSDPPYQSVLRNKLKSI